MTLVAVLSTAVFTGLLAASRTGGLPALRRRPAEPRPSGLAVLLRQAGSTWSPAGVRAAAAAGGLVALVVTWWLAGIPALGVVPAALVVAAPGMVLRRRAVARVRTVREAWPDALAQIGGSVRGGRPLSHALIDVSLNGPDPLRAPLSGLAARIQTVGLVAALQAVADVVGDPVTDRVVEVMTLAHEEGGGIVIDVVDDLAGSISAEVHASEEIDTLSLEGRLNARMVFALPWVVLVLLTAGEGPFKAFYASAGGTLVIAFGAVVSLLGVVLVARLSRIPEEPRVLRTGGST